MVILFYLKSRINTALIEADHVDVIEIRQRFNFFNSCFLFQHQIKRITREALFGIERLEEVPLQWHKGNFSTKRWFVSILFSRVFSNIYLVYGGFTWSKATLIRLNKTIIGSLQPCS